MGDGGATITLKISQLIPIFETDVLNCMVRYKVESFVVFFVTILISQRWCRVSRRFLENMLCRIVYYWVRKTYLTIWVCNTWLLWVYVEYFSSNCSSFKISIMSKSPITFQKWNVVSVTEENIYESNLETIHLHSLKWHTFKISCGKN